MTKGILARMAGLFVILTFAVASSSAADPSSPAKTSPLALRDALFEELGADADRFQRQFGIVKRVVKLVTPTIVHIDARRTESRGARYVGQETVAEAGSGVVMQLDESFYVLTNRHVVDNVPLANVQMRMADGYILKGTKMWSDTNTDVAVIRITEKNLLPARLGDSDRVEIGDFVLAVGSPFGLSHSVSYGIVSAKGRWDLALGKGDVGLQDFLQTDAAINPGNSGGPLLNLYGEVIGINTAIASNSGGNEGIGFSIPINLALNVAKQLVRRGSVATAYLGVVLDNRIGQQLSRETNVAREFGLSQPGGAIVKDITPGSPAADAEIKRGDIIVEFNGIRVEDDRHLVNLVSLTPLEAVVSVDVVRKKQLRTIHMRVGRRSDYERRGRQASQ